jgi:hypothetical protein
MVWNVGDFISIRMDCCLSEAQCRPPLLAHRDWHANRYGSDSRSDAFASSFQLKNLAVQLEVTRSLSLS